MAEIPRHVAEKIAQNDGRYDDDPRAYCVIEYTSKDSNESKFAVCYSHYDWSQYASKYCIVRVLWSYEDDSPTWLH
jgi:hypothetical protein